MASLNISELCYANDGYSVVNCAKYHSNMNNTTLVIAIVFGSMGGIIGLTCLCLFVDWAKKKIKETSESHLVQILTPRYEA